MTAQQASSISSDAAPIHAATNAVSLPLHPAGSQTAVDFIKDVFSPVTDNPVWIQSIGNQRDGGERPQHIATREMADVVRFVAKWDQPGRGLYFCVATIDGEKRNKDNAAEGIGPSIDIDFKDIDDTPADVTRKLLASRLPPSIIVNSGNGRHAYWLLKEAADLTGDEEAKRRSKPRKSPILTTSPPMLLGSRSRPGTLVFRSTSSAVTSRSMSRL